MLFTSGSTGEPKGVEVTHDAVMNTLEFINGHFEIGTGDRCLSLSTLEGDLSALDVFGMLTAGGSIVVVDEQHRRNPDHWAELIDRFGVTVLHFMPGWLQMLTDVGAGRLSTVRVVPTGGDWVKPAMVRRLVSEAPHVRFAGLGGATETAVHNTMCEVTDPPADWTAVPFGIPLPNNACRVVHANGGDCPDWVPGELWVGGRGIARVTAGARTLPPNASSFTRAVGGIGPGTWRAIGPTGPSNSSGGRITVSRSAATGSSLATSRRRAARARGGYGGGRGDGRKSRNGGARRTGGAQ